MIDKLKNKVNVKRKEVKNKRGMKMNVSAYARQNGISWSTAKKQLSGNTKRKKRTSNKKSKLADYYDIIQDKLIRYDCTATAIYEFIKEKGFTGSKSLVIKYVKKLKESLLKKATIRVESTPGLQGQVDWKESLTLFSKDSEPYKVNIFLYILSYSKYKYIELTIDRTQPTLFTALINAFKYCGGVPNEIWFDNMKTVVTEHNIDTNEVIFNDAFLEFSKNCCFKPIACRPFRPCTKGLVENLAKVMERLKAYNNEFNSYDDLYEIVKKLNENLNNEISQATGKTPSDLFGSKEKEYLFKINTNQFNFKSDRQVRKVSNESMVNYDKNKYSVPTEYIDCLVEIEKTNNQLYIYYSGKEIACHNISANKFNYRKEDLIEILEGIFPNDSFDTIENKAMNRLNGFDLRTRGENNE